MLNRKCVIVISAGTLLTAYSIIVSSTFLAFIGLTLLLWGFLFVFVLPAKYVRSEIMDSMVISSLSALSNIVSDLGYEGEALYLPPFPKGEMKTMRFFGRTLIGFLFPHYVPQDLKKLTDVFVYVPEKGEARMDEVFSKNSKGLFVVPPGLYLAKLLEKESGLDFSNVDLDFLSDRLGDLLKYDAGMVQEFEINASENRVYVRIVRPACEDLCGETRKLKNICPSIGCPLSSSVACVLTKATNRPVVVKRCELNNRAIELTYWILEE